MSSRSGILRNVSFRTKVERKSNSCSTRTVEHPMKNEVGRGGFIFGCVVLTNRLGGVALSLRRGVLLNWQRRAEFSVGL